MFADIVGSTNLMREDEAGTIAKRDTLAATIETAAKKYGGRVSNIMGDGFLVEFSSAVGAVSAAVEFLRESPLPLRVGLNVCDVTPNGNSIL
ncbi:MAG TPA: adenylate/guanylate cyclase domain-containing protein, partial [Reyranella sp.]|nr:adenylate/guanylate cyclase domain-containing protein [Reyranella sp.]